MSRIVARFCLALAVLALAMVGASPLAGAQAQEQLPYPGPFGDGGDFTKNTTVAETGADNDGDGLADGSVPNGASIDANPAGNGISFVAPDVQPSTDPADSTVGGTGGGDAGAGLAVTGVESELTMAAAMGLLAIGGTTLVLSRRRVANL
jgi:LPXTG-motif cell wall-anchored protein